MINDDGTGKILMRWLQHSLVLIIFGGSSRPRSSGGGYASGLCHALSVFYLASPPWPGFGGVLQFTTSAFEFLIAYFIVCTLLPGKIFEWHIQCICSVQFVNLCNFEIAPRKLQFAQLFINCAKHRSICKLHTHEASVCERGKRTLSSALKCRYGPKKLKRLTLVLGRPCTKLS